MDKSIHCLNNSKEIFEEGIPRHVALSEELRQVIESGKLRAGDRFFSENELVRKFGVSRGTVRVALQTLTREGLLRTAQGRRSVVLPGGGSKNVQELRGFSEEMRRRGLRPSSRLIALELLVGPAAVRAALALDEGERVFQIKRLRLADDTPLLLETSFVPHRICPDLTRYDLEQGSLYSIFENEYGISLARSEEDITAIAASLEVARLLGIPHRSPILQMERTAFSDLDQPTEFGRSLFRSDRFSLSVRSVRAKDRPGSNRSGA